MDHLFFLPELAAMPILLKVGALIGAVLILTWFFTFVIAHARNPAGARDLSLHIRISRYHAFIAVFAVLLLYASALLNWNLGIYGSPCLRQPSFYLRFSPELSLAALWLILLVAEKSSLIRGLDTERTGVDDAEGDMANDSY